MIDKRIDAPFLTKFNRRSPFLKSEKELYASIIEEIGNILSSKLKISEISYDSPYSYGVRDLQSIENSEESMLIYKENCRNAILRFEPRVSDVIITVLHFNNSSQTLEMELTCNIKGTQESFSTKMSFGN